ncbi:MAG TPA: ABC transporter substrate-binding protein [bacterium]
MTRHGAIRRQVLAGTLLALLLTLAWAPQSAEAQGTVKFIPHAGLRVVDPHWTTAYVSRNHSYLVYDTLFAMDKDFKPTPQMVDKWSVSEDGMTYQFTLRKGMKWHDLTPVTARDCVASLKRWETKDPLAVKLAAVTKSLEATGELSFTLVLKEPFGLVLDALAKPSGQVPFMMPERLAATDPNKQVEEIIGSGPYKFEKAEFQPGVKAVYTRFKEYVPRSEPTNNLAGGKVAHLDRVEWVVIPDNNTAVAALNAGEVDIFEAPPVDLMPLLKSNNKIVVQVMDPLGFQMGLRFNHLQPPFDNPKMRRAVLYMINQASVMQVVVGSDTNFYKVCNAIFFCNTPFGSTAGAEDVKQDFAKAKQLLNEAGYKGEKVVMMDPTDLNVLHSAVLATVPQLRQGGLNVEVQAMDWGTLLTRRNSKELLDKGGWSMLITAGTGADLIFPLSNFFINPLCDKGWFGWYCDPKMQTLQDEWSRTSDTKKAMALRVDMQREAYATAPFAPLGQYQQPMAYRDSVSGVVPAVVPVFWGMKKK